MKPANLAARGGAVLIDALITVTVLGSLTAVATGQFQHSHGSVGFNLHGRAVVVFILAAWVYWVLFEAYWGTTPGKRTFGLAVVGGDDKNPSLSQSVIRNLMRVIDGVPFVLPYLLGWLFALGDDNRRRLGDHVAGTRVVSRP